MCFCPSFSVDGENAKTEIHPYPRLARLYQELQILGISGSLRTAKLTIYIDNYLAAIPGGLRASQVFQAGIQFRLPIQNKVAEADLGADREHDCRLAVHHVDQYQSKHVTGIVS